MPWSAQVFCSEVAFGMGEAMGPLALARLGLCSPALARHLLHHNFSAQLCRSLALRDPYWSTRDNLTLEFLAICFALRSRHGQVAGPAPTHNWSLVDCLICWAWCFFGRLVQVRMTICRLCRRG
ncbi:unnamed protein product [Effrenium voratum]|nr:unnamed protein product [Effrenium voratum]